MPAIIIYLDGDGCWPDLKGKVGTDQVIHLGNGAPPIGFALFEIGTTSGKPSVTIRIDLPDGRTVLAETTLALLLNAARLFDTKCPGALD
jgi:hypothetical protein